MNTESITSSHVIDHTRNYKCFKFSEMDEDISSL
jgi:hypothetical protein